MDHEDSPATTSLGNSIGSASSAMLPGMGGIRGRPSRSQDPSALSVNTLSAYLT